ncbi:MAG TPA: peptidase T [Chitinophagaceae bacterium]|nr:peptidase T [Chitinophagaceae bacterium]
MLHPYTFTVAERFMRYVQIDTQSDPHSTSFPSTEKQKILSTLLADELKAMGITEVETDSYGYVYATIPATSNEPAPVICFCSHVDTAPDCSGYGVKPILHKNYKGQAIVLPDDPNQIISTAAYPYLEQQIGKDIITASGLTLLGADDKSGVAIIMDMAHYLMQYPELPHGTIKILFTPDEEVGRGTEKLDMQKLGADFGYTLDGGELGTYEDETFSADGVTIHFYGISAHPGYAKGKMVNALKLVSSLLSALPTTEWCPESTEKRQGFVHPVHMEGIAEKATVEFIVRDFETAQLVVYEDRLRDMCEQVIRSYPGTSYTFEVMEQYRNMKLVLDQYPEVNKRAEKAYRAAGLTVRKEPIRGGTDGSRLSFMGLPCANIFTGMQAIHSKHEWVSVYNMEKAVEVLVKLACNME